MSRRAWILVCGGYAVMAAGFIVFGFLLQHQVNRIDDTQKTIKATQRQALATQRRIRQTQADLGKLAIHNSGAICLIATAASHKETAAIVDAYLAGKENVTALFTPKCAEVARRAAHDVFDNHPPPGLNLEGGNTP